MPTHSKRRKKLSSRARSGQLYYRDELDLIKWRQANGEKWAATLREAVYDGLKYRRLLVGIPDADELDGKGQPMRRKILDLDALNETIQARLDRMEEGFKREALVVRDSAQISGDRASYNPLDATSLRTLVEEMLGPIAGHLHSLHLESEFTFRLAYCLREFVKEYLVRPHIHAPDKKSPVPGRDAVINRSPKQIIVDQQIEFDGMALEALKRIRSGDIFKKHSDRAAQAHGPAAPPAREGESRQRGNPRQLNLDDIASEVDLEFLDYQQNLHGGEVAKESDD